MLYLLHDKSLEQKNVGYTLISHDVKRIRSMVVESTFSIRIMILQCFKERLESFSFKSAETVILEKCSPTF